MEKGIKNIIDWCSFAVHDLENLREVIRKYLGFDPDVNGKIKYTLFSQ